MREIMCRDRNVINKVPGCEWHFWKTCSFSIEQMVKKITAKHAHIYLYQVYGK